MIGSDKGWLLFAICASSLALSFLLSYIILRGIMEPRLAAEKRLVLLSPLCPGKDEHPSDKAKKKKRTQKKRRFGQTLAGELQAAGVMMRPEEFATAWLVLSFIPSGLLALISGNIIIAGVFSLAGIVGPPVYVNKQKKKRVAAFEQQLGDALVTMCNCLRSGLTLGQAIENISVDMGEPISKEFARLCTEVKYGSTLESALNSMAERIGSDDLSLAVTAINIQRQTGGNLSETLAGISETIRARVKLKADVRVVTASGRMSGIVIGVMPIALGLIIYLINPEYMKSFVASGAGRIMLCIGAVMETLGFLMIKKILSIKY